MPLRNCLFCGEPLERPYIEGRFVGRPDSRLDGIRFECHAGCIAGQFPASAPLPPRIPDPVAEPTRSEWERLA